MPAPRRCCTIADSDNAKTAEAARSTQSRSEPYSIPRITEPKDSAGPDGNTRKNGVSGKPHLESLSEHHTRQDPSTAIRNDLAAIVNTQMELHQDRHTRETPGRRPNPSGLGLVIFASLCVLYVIVMVAKVMAVR